MRLAKHIGVVFLILIAIPMCYAFDCYYFDSIERLNCFEIANSSVSQEEKNILYADLLYGSSPYTYFDKIKDWNLEQDIVKSDDSKTASGQYVKNAWLDQFSIMPSVKEGIIVYVPEDVKVLTGFGYDIVVPDNYYSGGYPKTSQGDCRREYSVRTNTAKTEVFVDGNLQGNGNLVDAKISKNSVVESKLNVDVSVSIDHYQWYTWCCRRSEDGCTKHCHKCKSDSTETKADKIVLTDSISVQLETKIPQIKLEINDVYYGTTKGKVEAYNYSSFELNFEDSKLKRTAYLYDIELTGKPNYIANLIARPYENQVIKNLFLENNTFYVKNAESCKTITKTHFKTFEEKCEFIDNPIQELEEFQLQEFTGNIYFAFGLCIFIFINYVIYKVIIHYWGRFK